MTAFQSIQLGITHTSPTHDRYDITQLANKSILIQNGHTELGLAAIELAIALGVDQIYATGPSEFHSRLRSAGATPLGDQTFRWEVST
jgi:NADPH:quinone reductase-like Zn-dependent oxidoreductase